VDDQMAPLANRQIPGVSMRFLSAMDWALALRPENRPQNAAELRNAMRGSRGARTVQLIRRDDIGQSSRTQFMAIAPPSGAARRRGLRVMTVPVSAKLSTQKAAPRHALRSALACVSVLLALGWTVNRLSVAQTGGVDPVSQTTATALVPQPPPLVPVVADLADVRPPLQTATATATVRTDSGETPEHSAQNLPLSYDREIPRSTEAKVQHTHRRVAQRETGASSIRVTQAGPLELCANRNFFMRPYCVQRQCDAPRFANRAECRQLRPVARGQL
jgi:hypothetical protein